MTILKKVEGHSELLEDALFDLVQYGVVVVSDQKLMRWTDTKRVTPKMWKYIHQLFNEVLELTDQHKHGYQLYVGVGNDTYSLMIWDRGEGRDLADDRWWQSIEVLEQPKKRVRGGHSEEAELKAIDA